MERYVNTWCKKKNNKSMQCPKVNIEANILQAAEEVFYRKGFSKASMREIASVSQVGLSNIYNYFKSKDEIFRRILKPVISVLEAMLNEHHGAERADIMLMQSDKYLRTAIDEYITLIRKYRKLLVLLFSKSQGSSLENFRSEFTERSTAIVKKYFLAMKQKYPQVNIDISEFSVHLHTVWMFTLFEELIMHKIKPKELDKIVTEYVTFEVTGWRELMKI